MTQSSSLAWPASVEEELQTLSRGTRESTVESGETLVLHIKNMRKCLSLNTSDLAPSALQGYALFFDEKISREESARFYGEVVPMLCRLLLQLPSVLEEHYQKADLPLGGISSGLRLLCSQEAGIVFLSQELIAALLACSFFCLFPEVDRQLKHLQRINFDELFSFLYTHKCKKQESKIRCIIHYFERISQCIPTGFVSFERKVLRFDPKADYWANSMTPLCSIEVHSSGVIEDQPGEALEVDFADEYFGGLTLRNGCLQEEIRFMINPELIVGMLFLPRTDANEAIEIVGVERFSLYTGFGSSFQFLGDYADTKELDGFMRRKRRVVAIDAIRQPGRRQYKLDGLLREVNKAYTGYLHQCKHQVDPLPSDSANQRCCIDHEERKIGVATGNWGCGVFGGDPELKIMLQWIAISQSERPFMSYYTFGIQALQSLNQVIEKVALQEWTLGKLWNKVLEYSAERGNKRKHICFLSWLHSEPTESKVQ